MRVLAAWVLAAAGSAWAQPQTEAPPAPQTKEPERRPLNLKLDNPASWATVDPRAEKERDSLPTLGGDARPIPQAPLPRPDGQSSRYPIDPDRQ